MAGKYYVVWEGGAPGIYDSWPACQAQVSGRKDAKYKSYANKQEAERAYREGWKKHWGQGGAKGSSASASKSAGAAQKLPLSPEQAEREIDFDSVSVDVGTRGNPGPVEYRGVDTRTGDVLFSVGPISKGTNNLGEFLAIVHALAYLKRQGSAKTIYSDSRTALKWLRQKEVETTLARDASTAEIWELVDRALSWLRMNAYPNKVLKWETERWGEVKADYGRKG
ncbi:ribonuclease H family protein [Cohnella ginsengisoli]|uniref:Ribonuclease H n=1 Tax=Cohnella ginsengisoli TaxID=425004 RepID=A0A9X4KHP8_9BACL|nr:ribonuclease H family protein [Cohnella ginsengisoli]MDG0789840.1 ribonuclease H family protein [Cohnella ginsengisoli]